MPTARADDVAYLVNATARPGCDFANAETALAYGKVICDKVTRGYPYRSIVGDIKSDFSTGDEFQGSYLIAQSVNELSPASMWPLRESAAQYRPPPA